MESKFNSCPSTNKVSAEYAEFREKEFNPEDNLDDYKNRLPFFYCKIMESESINYPICFFN